MVQEGDVDSTTTLEHGQQGAGRGAPQPLGPLLFRLLSADDLSQPSARYSLEPFAEVEIGRSGLSGEQPRPTALRVGVRDPFASSRHAHLQRRDGGWRVRDEGSRNGTLVNGERAPAGEEVPLADGDLIEIGHTFFLFRASARGVSESGMEPAPEREDPLTLSPEWELELAKAARLGDENDLARAMHGIGNIESDMHHSQSALAIYRRALPMYERAGNLFGVEAMHANIGQQLERARDLDQAEKEFLLALELTKKLGARQSEGIVNESLGGLYLDRGNPARALETMKQATGIAQEIHDATTVAQTRRKQGESLHALGRTREAEEAFKDGIARLDSMGETARSGDGKLRLARLYLDLGRLDAAEAMARAAVEQHERAQVDSSEAGAALARVLVAAGKIGEARTVAVAAVARAPDELNGQIAAAEVELFEKHPELAIARLNKALAARLPEVPHRFDAELLLARALSAAGKTREAERRLRAIAAEAREKGFVLVEKAALEKR